MLGLHYIHLKKDADWWKYIQLNYSDFLRYVLKFLEKYMVGGHLVKMVKQITSEKFIATTYEIWSACE